MRSPARLRDAIRAGGSPNPSVGPPFSRSFVMSTVRQEAIRSISAAKHILNRVDFRKTHIKELFGINVFNEETQRARLPKPIFKALQKTIKQGAPLDPSVA